MPRHLVKVRWKFGLTAIFFFLLGNLVSLFFVPINRTCVLDNVDREYNIMDNSKLQPTYLVIFILSAPNNYNIRTTIRHTWLKLVNNRSDQHQVRIKHYFVIGNLELHEHDITKLKNEQAQHGDILSLPVHDSYSNLTQKVINTFGWLYEQLDIGYDFKFVLKCDDDTFIRIDNIMHELVHLEIIYLKSNVDDVTKINDNSSPYITVNIQSNSVTSHGNRELYWGYFHGGARVFRKGKWKETSWIFCDHYLPYALGGAYVLSKNLIKHLAKDRKNLRYYNAEDVSVGAWLAPVNNIVRIHDIRFDTEYESRGCQNTYIALHKINISTMQNMYKNLQTTGHICTEEFRNRPEYLYDWSKPPSRCCDEIVT